MLHGIIFRSASGRDAAIYEKLVSIDSGSYCKEGIDKIGKLLEIVTSNLDLTLL